MNTLRTSFATLSKTFGRRQTKAQSTVAVAPSHIPKMYHKNPNSDGVHKALLNLSDPRTYPRYAVALAAATFFSITTGNSFWYKHHHFSTDHKNDPLAPTHNERPVQVVRTLSNGPIAFNAKRYETLRHQGLGIDNDQWMKDKMARDANRTM